MKQLILSLFLSIIISPSIAQVYDTGNKVGIGISSKLGRKLTVNGGIDIIGEGSNDVGILLYRPQESNSQHTRWFLRADMSDNNSYPYLTNRTPNGKVVIKTGTANGGAENTHFTIEGGDEYVKSYFNNVFLGINKQNSRYPLHVYEKSGLGTTLCLDADTDANPNIMFQTNGVSQANIRVNDADSEQLQFQVGSSLNIAMSINPNGNILIGKTDQQNPTYKLDVNGSIRADKINVNTDGADFVFYPNYKLRPLKEVEAFIKENQRLPEIPSAAEMSTQGADLGELNTKLLQKIEELTLYTIEQEKTLKSQESKFKQQNSKIEKQQEEIEELKTLVKELLKNKN